MSTNKMATSTEEKSKASNKDQRTGKDGKVRVIKSAVDLQRLKLEKLMNNPTKEVIIPEMSKEKTPRAPLEFIRNIWGSSAGAGSGDFHVYRGVRRREYARQKFITEKAHKEELDKTYNDKVAKNQQEAEERSAKKRAKRLKKKQKLKAKKMKKKDSNADEQEDSDSGDSDSNEGKDDEEES